MRWIRYAHAGRAGFGLLEGDRIVAHDGSMFDSPRPNGLKLGLADVQLLAPVVPGKIVALANNLRPLLAKSGTPAPAEPLWFIKSPSSLAGSGDVIRKPVGYEGKVIFEGELGIVIGKRCSGIAEAKALSVVFGYTCVNDVTAVDIMKREPGWDQWSRSKSFDTFGPMGPAVATGLDPMSLTVKATLDGVERQNYPVTDMVFGPAQLVSLISRDVTLEPGDVIACGTSVGIGSMKPGSEIVISIEGIGELQNRFE